MPILSHTQQLAQYFLRHAQGVAAIENLKAWRYLLHVQYERGELGRVCSVRLEPDSSITVTTATFGGDINGLTKRESWSALFQWVENTQSNTDLAAFAEMANRQTNDLEHYPDDLPTVTEIVLDWKQKLQRKRSG
ncbi:hypothetical protein KW797_00205 [Candidatus Parcubacteria bacterium]|nr:hypothetical protein [Candidatus Parcubacteria bacterium]